MDGTLFDVPDSQANAAAYSRSSNGGRMAPYPRVRLVALAECGTRALLGAVFGSFATGERTLAARLLHHPHAGVLPADRGFPSFTLWETRPMPPAPTCCGGSRTPSPRPSLRCG